MNMIEQHICAFSCFILHILTCLGFEGKVAEVGEGAGGQCCHHTPLLDRAVSLLEYMINSNFVMLE